MTTPKNDVLQGTLALLILKTLTRGPMHGYGITLHIQRTREIGIRMAMGAQRSDILRLALSEGALLVVFGVTAGLVGSFVLTRFLQSMLFHVTPADPATFAAVAGLLAGVALLACFIPAQRATQVAPLVALRYE